MTNQPHILITGGAGFIGCHLARYFLSKGKHVTLYDILVRNSLKFFPDVESHPKITLIKADIRDADQIKSAVKNAEMIFHLAAIAGVSKYFKIPAQVMEVNVIGTYWLLEAAKSLPKLKAFFDFSTSECYGSFCFDAKENSDIKMENLAEKRWTYATSKLASEKFCLAYHWQFGLPFIGVRPFNIYGPGQVGEGVMSYMIMNGLRGRSITVTGKGHQCRTFCFIDDFIHGIDCLIKNRKRCIGHSFNIGSSGDMISMKNLAALVKSKTQNPHPISFKPHDGEDVMVRSPNTDQIEKLGFKPSYDLETGIDQTINWYQDTSPELD